jgi:hypothetical protein
VDSDAVGELWRKGNDGRRNQSGRKLPPDNDKSYPELEKQLDLRARVKCKACNNQSLLAPLVQV